MDEITVVDNFCYFRRNSLLLFIIIRSFKDVNEVSQTSPKDWRLILRGCERRHFKFCDRLIYLK